MANSNNPGSDTSNVQKNTIVRVFEENDDRVNGKEIFFFIYKYNSSVVFQDRTPVDYKNSATQVKQIVLPLPQGLNEQTGAEYGGGTFGGVAQAAQLAGFDAFKTFQSASRGNTSKLQDIRDVGLAGIDFLAKGGVNAGQAFGEKMLQTAAGEEASILRVRGGLGKNGGEVANPKTVTYFDNMQLRNHSFSWSFIAKTKTESDRIREVANTFKYYMLPDVRSGGARFGYPEFFRIDFSKEIRDYLHNPNICVCTGVDVKYNGESGNVFFKHTGAPFQVDITANFTEITVETKNSLMAKIKDRNNSPFKAEK